MFISSRHSEINENFGENDAMVGIMPEDNFLLYKKTQLQEKNSPAL
jgi:predicted ATP-grasp superfamily ATP-dependent carboligase